jgi:hypothetical protein
VGASSAAWPAASTAWSIARRATIARRPLPRRQDERELLVERSEQAALHTGPRQSDVLGGQPAALGEHHLQGERLVPFQPADRPLLIAVVRGTVDAMQGLGVPAQAVASAHLLGQRIVLQVGRCEHEANGVRDLP